MRYINVTHLEHVPGLKFGFRIILFLFNWHDETFIILVMLYLYHSSHSDIYCTVLSFQHMSPTPKSLLLMFASSGFVDHLSFSDFLMINLMYALQDAFKKLVFYS